MSRIACFLLDDTGEWRPYADDPDSQWRVFRNPVTGEETSLRNAAPGALFRSELYRWNAVSQDDGIPLCVKLPDGTIWCIDECASQCKYARHGGANRPDGHHCWTRTGVPPHVTAYPSILTRAYHGWLRDGYLEDA